VIKRGWAKSQHWWYSGTQYSTVGYTSLYGASTVRYAIYDSVLYSAVQFFSCTVLFKEVHLGSPQDEVGVKPQVSRGNGRGPAVVALDASDGHHAVCPLSQGLGQQELQLPHLVAAEFHPTQVVPLQQCHSVSVSHCYRVTVSPCHIVKVLIQEVELRFKAQWS